MSELDLDAIKDRLRAFEGRDWIDTAYIANAASFVEDVPRLIAEIERLQRLAGADPSPSSYVYESAMQALADERAKVESLTGLLAEILHSFESAGAVVDSYQPDHDADTFRSDWVMRVTLERWRSHLRGETSG